jgi:hypothetical protein
MKNARFSLLLARAKLSQSEAAHLLELTDRTLRRYVAGTSPVPRVVVLALLYLGEHAAAAD